MSTPTAPPSTPLLRAVAFVDGQNLFHDAERVFGYTYPNYDIEKLCRAVCEPQGWSVAGIRFYTGVPTATQNWRYNQFWAKKLFGMSNPPGRIEVVRRALKDRDVTVQLYTGVAIEIPTSSAGGRFTAWPTEDPWVTRHGRELQPGTLIHQTAFVEKGIDVGIAVDSIRYAIEGRFDVCVFFSRDADLEPAVTEIKEIARARSVACRLVSAFPSDGTGYGIPGTTPIRIPKTLYDACLDPRDYFPKVRK